MPGPVVFISYSHDSDEHREKVLRLAQRLRQDGLEARLDQYVNGTPEQGWPRWMLDQLDETGFVLVVCTETYYRRFRGHEEPGRGKGVDWEGALITQEIYDARSRTVKFVPIMLAAGQEPFIPEPLRGHTHYALTSEERYQALYNFLCGQAGVAPSPLGKIKSALRQTPQPLTFGPAAGPTMIGVPHRNPFFTGREDLLSRLHQQLQTQGISVLAQAAIYGLGGIGKTQTSIEYVHRFGEHYRFVLWVVAESETSIRTAYLSIARELGLIEVQADLETAVLALKAWLSREDGWLLVFDNADTPALVRAYLPSTRTGGKVLLTSRAKSFAKVGIREPLRVETLKPEDAVKFLVERTGNSDPRAAAELASELGYLPLALEQAAAYIETVGGGFADYLARYRQQGVALLEKGKPSTDYPKTVATTWAMSFAAVRETSPASADVLTAAAFLAPHSVPVEIFTLGGLELGDLLAQQLKGADEDPFIFWELLEQLERYSLLARLPHDAFELHRLTQEVIKDSLDEAGRRLWAERIIRALNAAYPEAEFETWRLCERLQPNARAAFELRRIYKLESYEVGRLFNEAGVFANDRGDYANAKLFNALSLEVFDRVLGSEHTATLTAMSNLALTLSRLGDPAGAKKLYEQSLEIEKRVQGGAHPNTLMLMNNLADTLSELGDVAGAKTLHWHVLTLQERALGSEHLHTIVSRNNLGASLRALGHFDDALRFHEQNLEICERVLGSVHPETLTSRSNLALSLAGIGNFTRAKELLEQSLEIRGRVLGNEHPATLTSRNNLAEILGALGDLTGARKLQEQNLEIRERVLGTEHPHTTTSTWNLLQTVLKLNDPRAEAQLMEKLRWLLDRDEDSIPSADQRQVRQWLLDLLNPS